METSHFLIFLWQPKNVCRDCVYCVGACVLMHVYVSAMVRQQIGRRIHKEKTPPGDTLLLYHVNKDHPIRSKTPRSSELSVSKWQFSKKQKLTLQQLVTYITGIYEICRLSSSLMLGGFVSLQCQHAYTNIYPSFCFLDDFGSECCRCIEAVDVEIPHMPEFCV